MSRRDHGRRGVAAIEFALWLPVLFILVSAVVDWGFYMHQKVNLARATMDGCRVGAAVFEPNNVAPGSISVVRANQRVRDVLAGVGMPCGAGCSVNVQYCPRSAGGPCGNPPFDGLLVRSTWTFTPFFGFANTPTLIDEEFIMASENQR